MPRGAENQPSGLIPERKVVPIHRQGIGAGLLDGKPHIEFHAESLLIFFSDFHEMTATGFFVLLRYGEMDTTAFGLVLNGFNGLNQMFLKRCATLSSIGVKLDQALW